MSSDHRPLSFRVAVAVEHDPVSCGPQAMGTGGVREQGGVVATTALGVQDGEAGSTWDLVRGVSTCGELEGTQLEEIKVLPVYWFAWSNFYPKTDVVD